MKKFLTFLAVMLMSLTAINAEDLYLRGGVNGWNASADYKFTDKGDGTFTLDKTFDLEGQFKFADANWGSVLNFGSTEEATCSEQGVTINLVTNGDNIITDGKLSITKIVVDKNQKKATFFGTKGAASDAVYTIAGQSALMGADWDPSATANDMTDMKDGTYQLVKENISLAVGDYEYKAAKNHAWGIWEYPSSGNNKLTISEAGTYTVTFTLTPATPALTAVAKKTGEPQPVETKYYAKNNWNGGEWSWKEMSATNQENVYMLDSVVFGGTGVNINTKTEDTDALWFAADAITVLDGLDGLPGPIPPDPRKRDTIPYAPARMVAPLEAPQLQAGDTIKLFFNAADSTLSAAIVGRPAPAARKEFVFVAGEAAEANPAMFAITWGKDGSNETVKMTQKGEEALYTANILETVDSVVLVRCASDATEIIWDGEGKNVWNQTANYELCDTMSFVAWVEETNLFAITCDTPKPVETKYYAKNNWNGGEWSWKEMTQFKETVYTLDSVVFGGTGININTKEEDTDAFWFDVDHIAILEGDYQIIIKKPTEDTVDSRPIHVPSRHLAAEEPQPFKLQAGDTIMLFFNAADTTLYADIYGRPAPAARKEFVFVAGEAAEANPAMFAITWGKDGSNETVKMTQKGEEALYTANILETVDSVVLVRCASDATEIIWDGEGKNVWNQTANYELCDTMSFVAWVEETNLFAITCDTPKPVETKYYAKNNWNGGEWSWKEMTQLKETFYRLDSVVFGGTGVNINTKEEDADALWFDLKAMTYVGEDTIQALDTVRFELAISKEDTVLTAIKLGRPAPAARKEFVFVAGEAAEANPAMFAITWGKDGSNETVKMTQKGEEALYTANILETVDSVVLVRCASDATKPIWEGEGTNVWNQTANYELCDTMYFESWVEETNLFTITCEAPKPVETKYYAKNNWNNGDWAWLEMTKEEDLYVLDSVVFGGTGVNINTKEEDADALWFDLKAMTYVGEDTIQALDTVRFELAISKEDTVLTAIKLGRPAPAARKEFVFVAGEAAEANPAMFAITWGKDGSNETVKMTQKGEEALYTANILETVDSVVLVRCASDATKPIWEGEGTNVWNQTANYELCDTMYFESWVEETNLFAITCEAPQPVEDKFYVTGNAALVGEEKAWKADAIEMTDGAYTFTALPAGEYEMKITNGAWDPEGQSWGSAALSEECSAGVGDKDGNIHFIVETPNDVNVAIAEGKVTVTGTFKQEPVNEGYGILVNGTTYEKGEASDIDGGKEYKVVLDLNIGDFVQLYDGTNHVAWVVDPEGSGYTNFDQHDGALYITEKGNYQFYVKIFTDATSGLYVGFTSDPTGLIEIMRNAKDGKFIINGNMIIRRNGALYTIQGARL